MRRVCSRPSSTVRTMARLRSSSSISTAVEARKIITGPSTRYSFVTSRPGAGVLAGGGDRDLAFALEELQGVAGPLRSFLFDDGQDLVLEVLPFEVEERVLGEGRVLLAVLLRDEGEDGFHQGRLAGRRGAADDDGERPVELSRDAARGSRGACWSPRRRRRTSRSRQGSGRRGRGAESISSASALSSSVTRDGRGLRLERLFQGLPLQLFERAQDAAEVPLDDVGLARPSRARPASRRGSSGGRR